MVGDLEDVTEAGEVEEDLDDVTEAGEEAVAGEELHAAGAVASVLLQAKKPPLMTRRPSRIEVTCFRMV